VQKLDGKSAKYEIPMVYFFDLTCANLGFWFLVDEVEVMDRAFVIVGVDIQTISAMRSVGKDMRACDGVDARLTRSSERKTLMYV
jgi:hypothetical protein